MVQSDSLTAGLRVAGVVLYVLAAVVLLLGAYMGLAFANAPAALWSATIAFQTPQLTPLWNALASGLAFIGILLVVISLIMSTLLIAGGLLLRRSAVLALRVQRLEAALERANIPLSTGAMLHTPLAETASSHPYEQPW